MASVEARSADELVEQVPSERLIVVSGDSHCGPWLERDLRPYCPKEHLDEFDAHARLLRDNQGETLTWESKSAQPDSTRKALTLEALERTKACPGQTDPDARLRDMDADGIAAEVIYAGGQNEEVLPWMGLGFTAGDARASGELRALGAHIWNAWLADFISVAPERLVGVMQIPIWDVEAAMAEIKWAHEHGLRAVNLPAPRSDFPAYNADVYEPFWALCQELELPLVTHAGAGESPLGLEHRAGRLMLHAEVQWLARRALWQMAFSGVFERYPRLQLVFTEQRVGWVPETLRELDAALQNPNHDYTEAPPKLVSDYWSSNCNVCASFAAPFELDLRHEVGVDNFTWGRDYPHIEGTWPNTPLALRHAFANVDPEDAVKILGTNGIRLYGLDEVALRAVADRIGPRPEDIFSPLAPEEYPEYRGLAFRTLGSYA